MSHHRWAKFWERMTWGGYFLTCVLAEGWAVTTGRPDWSMPLLVICSWLYLVVFFVWTRIESHARRQAAREDCERLQVYQQEEETRLEGDSSRS